MSDAKDYVEHKLGVLRHLRDLFHERARSRVQLPLELMLVAADLGISLDDVQGTIAELIALGYAKPYDPNAAHLAVAQGDCEISPEGLLFLHQYEVAQHVPPMNSQRGSAGFDLAP